jgi:Fur family transcriptional regulator, zinc uptake regulator
MGIGTRAGTGTTGRRRAAVGCTTRNELAILRVLRSAKSPMSAYAILDAVRTTGITAPTTVYRALSRLIAGGAAHRLESVNAYVTCSDRQHTRGPTVFAICRHCGHVDELAEADVVQRLQSDATRLGFHVEAAMIELTGRCASCMHADRPGAKSRRSSSKRESGAFFRSSA